MLAQKIAEFLRNRNAENSDLGISLLQNQTLGWGKTQFNEFLQRVIYHYISTLDFKDGMVFSKIEKSLNKGFEETITRFRYAIKHNDIRANRLETYQVLGGYYSFALFYRAEYKPNPRWFNKISRKKTNGRTKFQWYKDCFYSRYFNPKNISFYITCSSIGNGLFQSRFYSFCENAADIEIVVQEVCKAAANHLQRNIFAEL